MLQLLIGLVLGAIGMGVITYFVYRNNKAKIAELIETAKKVGVVLGE